jgi:hypothetical protein
MNDSSRHEPIVYLGPSLAHGEAASLLDADFRPPVRRGDLASVEAGRVVLILDGEFDQSLSVSPKEILRLLDGGSRVFGAASMGAIRATELGPMGMIGVGWIFEGYRSGLIEGDDEVALGYCPFSHEALTVPLVNVRYWLDGIEAAGLVGPLERQALQRRARRIFYSDRTPERLSAAIVRFLGHSRYATWLDAGFGEIPDIKATDARAALSLVARSSRALSPAC